jgi:hypothetical protein
MRHDADVATTLLNKLIDSGASNEHCIEVLREGQLCFDALRCTLALSAPDTPDGVEIECFKFADGSRAFRLLRCEDSSEVTPWIACPPLSRISPRSHT